MVTNVTSLLKTVKAVEDEHSRGTRALESAIEAIIQKIHSPCNFNVSKNQIVTSDCLLRCTRSISLSTAKIVAAGNSCKQDDIIAAANAGRRMINEMLNISKSSITSYSNLPLIQERIVNIINNTIIEYKDLLELVLLISTKSPESKFLLLPVSKRISENISELVIIAEAMKETDQNHSNTESDVAETELLGAAASIDSAARKLETLQPRKYVQVRFDFSRNSYP